MNQQIDFRSHVTIWAAFFAGTTAGLLPRVPFGFSFLAYVWLLFWFLALVAIQTESPWRGRLVAIFRAPDFKQVYRKVTARLFASVWHRFCAPAPAKSSARATMRAAVTAKVFDSALLIAVFYPIFLPVLIWIVSGQAGQLGSVIFLPEKDFLDIWPERLTVFSLIALLIGALVARSLALAAPKRSWQTVSIFLFMVMGAASGTLAGAVAFEFAFPGAFTVAVAFAVASAVVGTIAVALSNSGIAGGVAAGFAVAVAGAGTDSVAGLLAGSVAFTGAITVAVLSEWLWQDERRGQVMAFVFVALPLIILAAVYVLPWAEVDDADKQIFIFLGLFPIVNALFDALSYSLTLALMRLGLRRWNPIAAALADMFGALVLFLAVGAALTAAAAGMNALAGSPILELGSLFATMREDPASHLWVFLMLFSTALPTLVHFTLALLGAQAMVPRPLRKLSVRLIDTAPSDPFAAVFAPMVTGFVLTVPFAIIGFFLWLIWHWGKPMFLSAIGVYADILLALAERIGAF